ncbi:hypothetical protein Vadar_008411 [Vaccinium darrowii]|uniref:Uncharacterized protein n=1 Tax=Vaccinium darrowii TaxID=229202 RepID=A0ACB7Y726_9ERIC|nr:hypothetical protein Vadar_008411 [Vaccinium darrowii]
MAQPQQATNSSVTPAKGNKLICDTCKLISQDTLILKHLPRVKARLHDCFKLHSDAIDDLENAVKNYQSQKYAQVRVEARAALAFLTTCEERFKNRGLVSPVTKRYNMAVQLNCNSSEHLEHALLMDN